MQASVWSQAHCRVRGVQKCNVNTVEESSFVDMLCPKPLEKLLNNQQVLHYLEPSHGPGRAGCPTALHPPASPWPMMLGTGEAGACNPRKQANIWSSDHDLGCAAAHSAQQLLKQALEQVVPLPCTHQVSSCEVCQQRGLGFRLWGC